KLQFTCDLSKISSTSELAFWLRTTSPDSPYYSTLASLARSTISEFTSTYKTETTVKEIMPLCLIESSGIGALACSALTTTCGDLTQDLPTLFGLGETLFNLPPLSAQAVLDLVQNYMVDKEKLRSNALAPLIEHKMRVSNG